MGFVAPGPGFFSGVYKEYQSVPGLAHLWHTTSPSSAARPRGAHPKADSDGIITVEDAVGSDFHSHLSYTQHRRSHRCLHRAACIQQLGARGLRLGAAHGWSRHSSFCVLCHSRGLGNTPVAACALHRQSSDREDRVYGHRASRYANPVQDYDPRHSWTFEPSCDKQPRNLRGSRIHPYSSVAAVLW